MNKKLDHVMAAVFDRPWFIRPEVLATIADVVQFHVAGGRLSAAELDERLELAAARNGPRAGGTAGAISVIPIYGSIFPRANLMTEMSGGTTVDSIRGMFRASIADPSIGSILLEFDSPGGSVDGIEELATEIRASRGDKPIVAIANYGMASAAYYLASQADEIVASPSSMVGWIGCVAVHTEFSKADEMGGVTNTVVRNPPGKYAGNSVEPLSPEGLAEIQQMVDDYSAQFVNAVAKGRGVSVATVKADYGQGGGMTAQRAKAAGLVDRVETYDQTLQRLATGKGPRPRGVGVITAGEIASDELLERLATDAALGGSLEPDPAAEREPDQPDQDPEPEPDHLATRRLRHQAHGH